MKIKKVRLEDIETQALTAAIVDGDFLRRVRRKLKPSHFKGGFGAVVIKWVFEYWDQYSKAPGVEIERIFREKKRKLNAERAKLVRVYLKKLSADWERQKKYNPDYLYDNLINYIRKRDIENLSTRLSTHIESDRVDMASKELIDFQSIHKETSQVFNPFEEEYIRENWREESTGILHLPDALGEMIGPLDRGWLVSFTAPEKRGKTWWLLEMAFQAVSQKRNVLFVSFEMSPRDMNSRIWSRLTAASSKAKVRVPVFDCLYNQTGECDKVERVGRVKLVGEGGAPPEGQKRRGYKVCTSCRVNSPRDYSSSFWYEDVLVSEYAQDSLIERADSFDRQYGEGLRVKCFPAFTAGMVDINAIVDELEVNEGFHVDVLITDYLDIMASESGSGMSERGGIDATWKSAKSIAQRKSLLHLTVDQSSKITYEKDIRLYDTSEDKRKNAHVDVKVAMNKLPPGDSFIEVIDDVELLRFSVIAHRHKSFRTGRQVVVLQHRGIGQPLLDCDWYRKKMEGGED